MWHTVYSACFPRRMTEGNYDVQNNWISGNVANISHLLISRHCCDPQRGCSWFLLLGSLSESSWKTWVIFYDQGHLLPLVHEHILFLFLAGLLSLAQSSHTDRWQVYDCLNDRLSAPIVRRQSQWGLFIQWVRRWPFEMDFTGRYCAFFQLMRWKISFSSSASFLEWACEDGWFGLKRRTGAVCFCQHSRAEIIHLNS